MNNLEYLELIENFLNDKEEESEEEEKLPKKERKKTQRELFYLQLKKNKNKY